MNLNLTSLLASDPVNTNLLSTAERSAAFLPSPLGESSYQKILEFQSKRIVWIWTHQSPCFWSSDPAKCRLPSFLPSPLRESSYQKILEFESKRIVMNPNLTNLRLIKQAQIECCSSRRKEVPHDQLISWELKANYYAKRRRFLEKRSSSRYGSDGSLLFVDSTTSKSR